MIEKLRPCPFCGNEHPDIVSGDGVMCVNGADCFGSNMFDCWNHRTPGPATKAMLRLTREQLANEQRAQVAAIYTAFLFEWPDEP